MTERISTLGNVKLSGSDYLFVVLNESNYDTEVQKILGRQIERLGVNLGTKVRVSRPTQYETSNRMLEEVREKPWPDEVLRRIETEQLPFILILRTDFDDFDPSNDNWFIVWLSSLRNPKTGISRLCDVFDRNIRADGDLFQFLETKFDVADPSFPPGSLSSRDHLTVEKPHTKGKKPGVLDREFGLEEALPDLIAKVEVTTGIRVGEHRWKMALAREAGNYLVKKGFDPRPKDKSVYDALRKNNIYEKLEKEQKA